MNFSNRKKEVCALPLFYIYIVIKITRSQFASRGCAADDATLTYISPNCVKKKVYNRGNLTFFFQVPFLAIKCAQSLPIQVK